MTGGRKAAFFLSVSSLKKKIKERESSREEEKSGMRGKTRRRGVIT